MWPGATLLDSAVDTSVSPSAKPESGQCVIHYVHIKASPEASRD